MRPLCNCSLAHTKHSHRRDLHNGFIKTWAELLCVKVFEDEESRNLFSCRLLTVFSTISISECFHTIIAKDSLSTCANTQFERQSREEKKLLFLSLVFQIFCWHCSNSFDKLFLTRHHLFQIWYPISSQSVHVKHIQEYVQSNLEQLKLFYVWFLTAQYISWYQILKNTLVWGIQFKGSYIYRKKIYFGLNIVKAVQTFFLCGSTMQLLVIMG